MQPTNLNVVHHNTKQVASNTQRKDVANSHAPRSIDHELLALCEQLGLAKADRLEFFHPRTRDRDDISAWRDPDSEIILLSSCNHIDDAHYAEQELGAYWRSDDLAAARATCFEDDERRATLAASMLRSLGRTGSWLDVGTGAGGFLHGLHERLSDEHVVQAIEPQVAARKALQDEGWQVAAHFHECADASVDYLSAWHVLEHIQNPLSFLQECWRILRPNGTICIEVPHARDALLAHYESEAFCDFTLWSEHLLLHTQHSLRVFAEAAGFQVKEIRGIQRYPLANHLHWLSQGKPGGHMAWEMLNDSNLDEAYTDVLRSNDWTDTLVLIAERAEPSR